MEDNTQGTMPAEPTEPAAPAEENAQPTPIEDQTPPEGFEPQSGLSEGQDPGINERQGDLVADAEVEVNADPADGAAADNDDSVEDDPQDQS